MLRGEVRWQLIELEASRADSDLLLNHNNHQPHNPLPIYI